MRFQIGMYKNKGGQIIHIMSMGEIYDHDSDADNETDRLNAEMGIDSTSGSFTTEEGQQYFMFYDVE